MTIGRVSLKSICKVYKILFKGYLHSVFSKSIFIWFSHWLNWVSVFISPVNPSPVPEPQRSLILLCVRGKSAESLKSFENEPHILAVQHFRQGTPNLSDVMSVLINLASDVLHNCIFHSRNLVQHTCRIYGNRHALHYKITIMLWQIYKFWFQPSTLQDAVSRAAISIVTYGVPEDPWYAIVSPLEVSGPFQHSFHCICHKPGAAYGTAQKASEGAPAV